VSTWILKRFDQFVWKEHAVTTLSVYNVKREAIGKQELPDSVFAEARYEHLFHEAVRHHLARKRAGTASTKTRHEVSGGGRKPWRQKGTGRARQGSTRATQWVGGGRPHAPRPRSYGFKIPRKALRAALRSALSRRVREETLFVLDGFNLSGPRTKDMVSILERFGGKRTLIVLDTKDANVIKSASNIIGVTVRGQEGISVYDILRHDTVVVTQAASEQLAERLAP